MTLAAPRLLFILLAAATTAPAQTRRGPRPAPPPRLVVPGERATPEVPRIDAVRAEMSRIEAALVVKLMTPEPALVEEARDFLAGEGERGIARIHHGKGGVLGCGSVFREALVLPRGFRFRDPANVYASLADLRAEGTVLGREGARPRTLRSSTGLGFSVHAGRAPLDAVDSRVPEGLGESTRAAWAAAWADGRPKLGFEVLGSPAVEHDSVGTTYLLRYFSAKEGDLLVGVRIVGEDEEGLTFRWRVLRDWGPKRPKVFSSAWAQWSGKIAGWAPRPGGEASDDEWTEFNVEELRVRYARLLEEGAAELSRVSPQLALDYRARIAAPTSTNAGVVRLVDLDELDPLAAQPVGLDTLAFTAADRFRGEVDVTLDDGDFVAAQGGSRRGLVLDLGALTDAQILGLIGGDEAVLEGSMRSAWRRLRAVEGWKGMHAVRKARQRVDEVRASVREHGLGISAECRAGHTYALRTVFSKKRDVLAIFTVLEAERDACVIAWHVIEER